MKFESNTLHFESTYLETVSKYCEWICIDNAKGTDVNMFGRPITYTPSDQFAQLFGAALGGIRVAAYVSELDQSTQLVVDKFIYNKIPLVLTVERFTEHIQILTQKGAILITPSDKDPFSAWLFVAQKITESTLCPVIIIPSENETSNNWELNKPIVKSFLGAQEELIESPTKAQRMVFGAQRKSVPTWNDLDLPSANNSIKNGIYYDYSIAANKEFYSSENQQLIKSIILHFNTKYDQHLSCYQWEGDSKARLILVGIILPEQDLKGIGKRLRLKVAQLRFNVQSPLMSETINLLKGVEKIGVVESLSQSIVSDQILQSEMGTKAIHIIKYHSEKELDQELSLSYLQKAQGYRSTVYWDIPFTRAQSAYPNHQLLLQKIQRSFPDLTNKTLRNSPAYSGSKTYLPSEISAIKNGGPNYSKLNRFYQDTALFANNLPGELVADPYQALPIMPMLSGAFKQTTNLQFPDLKLNRSEGILTYLGDCPNNALIGKLFSIDTYIKDMLQEARKKGVKVNTLISIMKKWVGTAEEVIKNKAEKVEQIQEILLPSIQMLLQDESMEEDKKNAIKEEFDHVFGLSGKLKIAITERFYWSREKQKPQSGLLYSLAINPFRCNACGICIERATDGSICNGRGSVDHETQFNLLDGIPATAPSVIQELAKESDALAADTLYLSEVYAQSVIGTDNNDNNALQRLFLRYLTSLCDQTLQDSTSQFVQRINKCINDLSGLVKKQLSNALPTAHLDSLMDVVHERPEERLTADKLVADWGHVEQFKTVNKPELELLLTLIHQLKGIKGTWEEGPMGMGRPKYSIVFTRGFEWASQFPDNAFKVPTVFDDENPLNTAQGIFAASLRKVLENLKVLKRAELIAKKRYKAEIHDQEIARLNWDSLEEDERAVLPRVLVVGNSALQYQSELTGVLQQSWPIQIVIYNDSLPTADNVIGHAVESTSPWSIAFTANYRYSARIAFANRIKLFETIKKVASQTAPALLEVVAPKLDQLEIHPTRWPELYALMQNSRALIEYEFDPLQNAKSVGEHLKVDLNPNFEKPWKQIDFTYEENEVKKQIPYQLTWADWAFSIKGLKELFTLIDDEDNISQVSEYELNKNIKISYVIFRTNESKALVKYLVPEPILKATALIKQNVQMFQELAGLYTMYPEKLRQKVRADLESTYQEKHEGIIARYEDEKSKWQENHLQEVQQSVKEKLVELARGRQ